MSEVRLIDANALRYKNLAEVNGRLTYVLTAEEINNAPTFAVNCKDCDGYEAGYSAGLKDAERPQGEWENDSDNLPICNKCGEIALQRIFVKMPHLIQDVRMVRSNYCPNCGADMRKGGAE